MKLFVGSLSDDTTEQTLRAFFNEFGAIVSVAIPKDRLTGKVRNFAFVELEDEDRAQSAIKMKNGQTLDGKSVTVSQARPMRDRD